MSEDLGTLERRSKGGLTIKNHHNTEGFVVGKGAAVEYPECEQATQGTGGQADERVESLERGLDVGLCHDPCDGDPYRADEDDNGFGNF